MLQYIFILSLSLSLFLFLFCVNFIILTNTKIECHINKRFYGNYFKKTEREEWGELKSKILNAYIHLLGSIKFKMENILIPYSHLYVKNYFYYVYSLIKFLSTHGRLLSSSLSILHTQNKPYKKILFSYIHTHIYKYVCVSFSICMKIDWKETMTKITKINILNLILITTIGINIKKNFIMLI